MTNVVVATKKTIRVSTNATTGVISTNIPVTLKNNPIATTPVPAHSPTSLTQLSDVLFLDDVTGATLVFDANTNQFIVEPLNYSEIYGTIDAGTF